MPEIRKSDCQYLTQEAADVIEDRLYELEEQCSFTAREWEQIWSGTLREYIPEVTDEGRVILTARVRDAVAEILRIAMSRRDFAITFEQWKLLCETVLPERYRSKLAEVPTRELPGTAQKEMVLQDRYERQDDLAHPQDRLTVSESGGIRIREGNTAGNHARRPGSVNGEPIELEEIDTKWCDADGDEILSLEDCMGNRKRRKGSKRRNSECREARMSQES